MPSILHIPTKGILAKRGLIAPYYLILGIEVRKATGGYTTTTTDEHGNIKEVKTEKKFLYVKIIFEYENEIYTDIKYLKPNTKVSLKNSRIEIIENKPVIKLDIDESLFETISPDIKIIFDE